MRNKNARSLTEQDALVTEVEATFDEDIDEERGAKTDAYVAGLAIDATKGAVNHHKEKKAQRKNRGPVADAMIVSAGVKATEAATKKVVKHHQNKKN